MPKITKARGATSRFDGSNRLPAATGGPEPTSEPPAPAGPTPSGPPSAAAPVAEWREYAESLGIVTAGLTKKQIRDAVSEE